MSTASIRLEDTRVGTVWCSTPRTLTEAELSWACMVSGDWHPIHADQVFAQSSPAGQRVFHGGFGVFLALGAAAQFPDIANRDARALGTGPWKFLAPLFIGDTIHLEIEIVEMRRTSDGRRLVIQKRVLLRKSDQTIAQEGTVGSLISLAESDADIPGAPSA